MNLWFQTFVLVGLCMILKYGSILNPVRDFLTTRSDFFEDMFKCSMCLGFWVGIFAGSVWFESYWMIPLWGFYSSAICWFADYVTMVCDRYLDKMDSSIKVDP
jgi:hypothetical protein